MQLRPKLIKTGAFDLLLNEKKYRYSKAPIKGSICRFYSETFP